jgi:predicted DNA-binding protein
VRKINLTRHVGFLMTEEMFQQISKITDKMEIPISQYIREVLEDRLNQAEGGSMR